jgi:5-methyltetrahydropteroyltriglutamate--homocysteine methyltransferase
MTAGRDRILTTHVGSLPRPDDLATAILAQDRGEAVDPAALGARIATAVREIVAKQVECGIDLVGDGEMSKVSYVNYLKFRIEGFGEPAPLEWTPADVAAHPEFNRPAAGHAKAKNPDPPACRAPIRAKDRAPLEADLANFRAALSDCNTAGAFLNAASPGVIAMFMPNRFYPSEDAYVAALAEAMQEEYEAIHAAGFLLQIDCPDLAMARHMSHAGRPLAEFRRAAARNVEALNHATRNIPPGAMRLHVCWGNYPGPHTHDVPLKDIADIVFRARPQAILFEAANPCHAHEWEDMAAMRIPDDAILVPGVIETTSNRVEHPALIAQRLRRFADIVGRERVTAGTDCGFATFVGMPRVHPSVAWAKLRNLAEGARLASAELWRRRGA